MSAGVRTTDLTSATSIDYILANVDVGGEQKTRRVPVADFVAQLQAGGAFASAFNLDRVALATDTTISGSYNGKTIRVTAAGVTLTIASVASLAEGHVTWIVNGMSNASVWIESGSGDFVGRWLYPGDKATIYKTSDGASSILNLDMPAKYHPVGGERFYVDEATGSNDNDGLDPTRAFADADYATRFISYNVVHNGAGSTVKFAAETMVTTFQHTYGIDGYHIIYYEGADVADPTQTVCQRGNGGTFVTCRDFSALVIRAVKFVSTGTGATAVSPSQTGIIDIWDCHFDVFAGGIHIFGTNGGFAGYVIGGLLNRISGNATYHWYFAQGSHLICTGCTITVDGGLTLTYWLLASGCSVVTLSGVTFAGAGAGAGLTATKYHSQQNANIVLGGVTLPGATSGTFATGGQAA